MEKFPGALGAFAPLSVGIASQVNFVASPVMEFGGGEGIVLGTADDGEGDKMEDLDSRRRFAGEHKRQVAGWRSER